MNAVSYSITIGSLTARSGAEGGDLRLRSLVCDFDMDAVGGRCAMEFAAPVATAPAPDDEVKVECDGGDGLTQVFCGQVEQVTHGAERVVVTAVDGLAKLARLDTESSYEGVSAGTIVKDLIDQAGATAGEVTDGPNFSAYYIHRGPRALTHVRRLAMACGSDVYTDNEGAVHFAPPRKGGSDFQFQYGKDVLAIGLTEAPSVFDGASVWGEGAASTQGADKAHWLATDLGGVNAQAATAPAGAITPGNAGDHPRVTANGAIRTFDDAQVAASGQAQAIAARPVRGFLKLFGAPGVRVGDLVSISGMDREQWGALADLTLTQPLRVRRVKHVLNQQVGFVSRLEF